MNVIIILAMLVCLAAVLVTTNAWLGELVGAIVEEDTPHPEWPFLIAACVFSGLLYNWLGLTLIR